MQNSETVYSVQQDPRPRPSLLHARTIQAPANQNFQKCHMRSVKSLTEEPCLALGSLLEVDFKLCGSCVPYLSDSPPNFSLWFCGLLHASRNCNRYCFIMNFPWNLGREMETRFPMFEESWAWETIYDEIKRNCLSSETKDLCFLDVAFIVPRVNKEWC